MGTASDRLAELDPADLARGRRPYAPAKLAHFVLKTPRRAKMVRWYQTLLDAQVVFSDDRLTFLTFDTEHHRIAIVQVPWPIAAAGLVLRYARKVYGVDHIAFSYATLGELLATYRRVARAGIRPVWCINHGPTTSLYYEDPDGNRLELQYDNFASLAELVTFMDSGEFERNPIGVEFDPELLAQQLDSGVPLARLVRRGSATRPGEPLIAGYRTIRWKTL